MKNYYLVRSSGAATVINHDELNSYPFVSDDEAHIVEEEYSEDWQLYESTGTEWCIAHAPLQVSRRPTPRPPGSSRLWFARLPDPAGPTRLFELQEDCIEPRITRP